MTEPIFFADPRAELLAVLRAAEPAATYGTKRLDEIPTDSTPTLPYVRVSVDSTAIPWQVQETVNARIAVWHDTEAEGELLARRLRSLLLAFPGNAAMRRPLPGTGPTSTTDPDTGRPLSAFTITARLRPIT
jgi:hypothetical protein